MRRFAVTVTCCALALCAFASARAEQADPAGTHPAAAQRSAR